MGRTGKVLASMALVAVVGVGGMLYWNRGNTILGTVKGENASQPLLSQEKEMLKTESKRAFLNRDDSYHNVLLQQQNDCFEERYDGEYNGCGGGGGNSTTTSYIQWNNIDNGTNEAEKNYKKRCEKAELGGDICNKGSDRLNLRWVRGDNETNPQLTKMKWNALTQTIDYIGKKSKPMEARYSYDIYVKMRCQNIKGGGASDCSGEERTLWKGFKYLLDDDFKKGGKPDYSLMWGGNEKDGNRCSDGYEPYVSVCSKPVKKLVKQGDSCVLNFDDTSYVAKASSMKIKRYLPKDKRYNQISLKYEIDYQIGTINASGKCVANNKIKVAKFDKEFLSNADFACTNNYKQPFFYTCTSNTFNTHTLPVY
ncbi:MAG: hypothetical protein CR971_00555 [candidate division SR1 bacterium]|nr:MAG: hypothetical protein CR971_00555 [candidate division SR1 bacterium]